MNGRRLIGHFWAALNFTVRRLVEPTTDAGRLRERMRELVVSLEPPTQAPWIPELEQRFKRKLPPLYRTLILHFRFASFEVGDVELFGNLGVAEADDITVAPFSDPFLSQWLINHGYIHFGRPSTGSYDPVCFDYSMEVRGSEPKIVSLDHEDILLERKKVQKRSLADSFGALLGVRGA